MPRAGQVQNAILTPKPQKLVAPENWCVACKLLKHSLSLEILADVGASCAAHEVIQRDAAIETEHMPRTNTTVKLIR
jgi:hypothetical protein